MILLQPLLLWGTTLAALPILIHLLNRIRHRSVSWGAMMFLQRISRRSSRSSRLRHYLILACRMLALAALALAMTRPLSGAGWMGLFRGRTPEAILVLFDRSASMERLDETGISLRQRALNRFEHIPPELLRGSRIVFIDSVFQTPREVASLSSVRNLVWSGASDTAAFWPGLFETALDWITRHQPGRTELWVVSDGQASNWQPGSRVWADLNERLDGSPAPIRVRMLTERAAGQDRNIAIRAGGAARRPGGGYELAFTLTADAPRTEPVPAALITTGGRLRLPLDLPTPIVDGVHRLSGEGSGWAGIELPADSHPADNIAWFVFGPAPQGIVWAHAEDGRMNQRLRHSFRPSRATDPHPVHDGRRQPASALADAALAVWQGHPPQGQEAEALEAFILAGGTVFALPPTSVHEAPENPHSLWAWGETQEAPPDRAWRVSEWNEMTGPWAQTAEGDPLPLGEAAVYRRRAFASDVLGAPYAEARTDDEIPLLLRIDHGSGRLYVMTSLPDPEWSDLWDGRIWIPALWRMRSEGARRLGTALHGVCGVWQPSSPDDPWEAVAPNSTRDPRIHAGIYRLGGRHLALNRPQEEDDPTMLDGTTLRALLPDMAFDTPEAGGWSDRQPAEITWTLFLIAALFFLTEAILALGLHPAARSFDQTAARGIST